MSVVTLRSVDIKFFDILTALMKFLPAIEEERRALKRVAILSLTESK